MADRCSRSHRPRGLAQRVNAAAVTALVLVLGAVGELADWWEGR